MAQQTEKPPAEQAAIFRFEEDPKKEDVAKQNLTKGIILSKDSLSAKIDTLFSNIS